MSTPIQGWLTLDQACEYTQRSRETLRRAAVHYQRTQGREGLKGAQRKAHACWRFSVRDLDRWVEGDPPARSKRSGRAA